MGIRVRLLLLHKGNVSALFLDKSKGQFLLLVRGGDNRKLMLFYGDVIAIGLRSVKLQTLDDSTVTIPNNMFLSEVTSCGNYGVVDMQIMVDWFNSDGYEADIPSLKATHPDMLDFESWLRHTGWA